MKGERSTTSKRYKSKSSRTTKFAAYRQTLRHRDQLKKGQEQKQQRGSSRTRKKDTSVASRILEVTRSSTLSMISTAAKPQNRKKDEELVLQLLRTPAKYRTVYHTVMGFSKWTEKILVRDPYAPIKCE